MHTLTRAHLCLLLLLVMSGFVCVICDDQNDGVVVSTNYGPVRGERTDKARQFLGIPYATPPTGELRWVKPVTVEPWKDVLNVTTHKPACPQKYCAKFLPGFSCPHVTSEDCLYLNIWTPLDANASSFYPVMLFIHGGAFRWGSASNRIYDGNNLTYIGKVIVVDIEYRLGLFGFLYTGDTPDDAHGNFGIQDQRLAMQWVQQNIQYFGGDPYKVTIFGQSAGAQSVFVHLMSNKSEGLFRAAIVESAPFAVPYRTKPQALLLTKKVSEILKCSDANIVCFREKTTDEINDAEESAMFRLTANQLAEYFEPYGPIIDNDEVQMLPMAAAQNGLVQKVPIMVGTVSEEGVLFVYGAWKLNMSKNGYETALRVLHPTNFRLVEAEYQPGNMTDFRSEFSQVVTDYLFTCATRNATQNLLRHGNNQTVLSLCI